MTFPPSHDTVTSPHPASLTSGRSEELCREWYEAYGPRIYSYLRFHLSSADVAEEVTAETFYKAVRAVGQFDRSRGDAQVWLFRIARNTLRDHQRRDRLRRHLPLGRMRDLVTEAPSPEERLLWEERVAGLLEAIAKLPRGDRELIGLRYGSELEPSEIGSLLGLSDSVVRTRLWRALKRLRATLGEPAP
jgi:RNA polymerase sigma factor (sigma-70 family)